MSSRGSIGGGGGGGGGGRRRRGRSRTRWLVCLSVVVGGLLLAGAPAPAVAAEVKEEFVSNVSASGATLGACVNPESSQSASYKFEYGPSATYGANVMGAATGTGTCVSGVNVEAHIQGLKAKTAYDYRVVVTVEGALPHAGSGESFTTQPTGGELTLPDGRRWELVSPAKKDGAAVHPIEESGGVIQAAEDGGAITFTTNGPVEADPANADETQVLSTRGADGGWSSQDIATPVTVAKGVPIGSGQEYRAFSSDLSVGLVEPFGLGLDAEEAEGAVPLAEGASEATPYLRADAPLSAPVGSEESAAYEKAVAEGGYLPLVIGCPEAPVSCKPRVAEDSNATAGAKFGGLIRVEGADPDLSHVIVHANETSLLAGAEESGLYEWSADKPPQEQLQLVSVLPDVPAYEGTKAGGSATLGTESGKNARGAISSDGSRIVWSYEGHVFMRYTLDGQSWRSMQLDIGSSDLKPGLADFQFASSDGSRVFFTDGERLTPDSNAEEQEPELYECEMAEEASGLKCNLSDLTIAKNESADVQGTVVVGSSESSYIYFVAKGVLTSHTEGNAWGETATDGADNLYMLHYDGETSGWGISFIAELSQEDNPDWAGGGTNLEHATSMVSPNGENLVFMSDGSPTGYDNRDVNSGALDEEVYLYRAPGSGAPSGRLLCVSCNPTGERPTGVLDSEAANYEHGALIDEQRIWSGGRWLAANIPGWTGMAKGVARYQSRYLSDSGRVFFNSSDALVPQATNGLMDVYEYEPAGTVSSEGVSVCNEATATFSVASGGCTSLISSGSSGEESVFLDASASGEDVFFLTSAQLVSEDKDTARDVYDAHECSAAAPCGARSEAPPPCDTEASCKPSPTPQPTIFGAGPSETFVGAGNPGGGASNQPAVVKPVVTTKVVKCHKGFTKKKNRCVKRKKAKKAKRVTHGRRGK